MSERASMQIGMEESVQLKSEAVDKYVTDYSDVQITETEYLFFPWFVRGKLNSVQGDTSTGKSTFLYAIGAYVSTGRGLFGIPCEAPGNVMFITLEDSESDILTAFVDAGGNTKHLRKMPKELIARIELGNADVLQFIEKAITKHKLKFLTLDPIQNFLSGDMNKASETRPQLANLMEIAERTGCCIAFIQHTTKDQTRSALHKGIGSVDILAATRSALQIVSDPDDLDVKIAFTIKNNTASRQDVETALRYVIRDHPGSIDPDGKHHRYHGHAEFTGVIPSYNERIYKRALKKAQEREEGSLQARTEYASDPLVITLKKLIMENPDGLFIGHSDLIRRITDRCNTCPYTQTKDKASGLSERIRYIRPMLIERDRIQIDPQPNALKLKPYTWNGKMITEFAIPTGRERGIQITPLDRAE